MTKAANVAQGSKMTTKHRPQIIEVKKKLKGESLSEAFTCEKALDIYGDQV